VFCGTCLGEPVAVKTMIDVTEQNARNFKAEILLTATLRHPNIVNFVGACWDRELTCLVCAFFFSKFIYLKNHE
jgi:serine/threonine protein kinase